MCNATVCTSQSIESPSNFDTGSGGNAPDTIVRTTAGKLPAHSALQPKTAVNLKASAMQTALDMQPLNSNDSPTEADELISSQPCQQMQPDQTQPTNDEHATRTSSSSGSSTSTSSSVSQATAHLLASEGQQDGDAAALHSFAAEYAAAGGNKGVQNSVCRNLKKAKPCRPCESDILRVEDPSTLPKADFIPTEPK